MNSDPNRSEVRLPVSEPWRVGCLLAVSILVYVNTLWNGFALDDNFYIFNNPAVLHPSVKGFFSTPIVNVFRPVSFAALAANWWIGGQHPWGYHLVNLLLHGGVTLLVYLVLKKLLEGSAEGVTVAWVAALLYAVHPLHTEAVASIIGRSEVLAAGLLLVAWLLYLDKRAVAALLCFVLALLAKESAVVFLPLIVVGDYARNRLNWKCLRDYAWFGGAAAVYLGILWKAQGGRFGEKVVNFLDNPLAQIPARLRILNALRIDWKYVGLHVYPATLSCDYSYNAITLYSYWRNFIPAIAATVIAFGVCAWLLWTGRRAWVLGMGIYVAGFAATSNILVPTGTIMGERLAYLPSIGFCLLVALIWMRFSKYEPRAGWVVLTTIVVLLAARTIVRNRDWRDNFTLFSAAVRAVPESAKAHAGLGEACLKIGNLDKAEKEYQVGLQIYPNMVTAMTPYGIVESRLGHDEHALKLLSAAVSVTDPADFQYPEEVAAWSEQLTKMGENDSALRVLNQLVVDSPSYAQAWADRAAIHYQRGEDEFARSDAAMAMKLDPANAQARNLLIVLHRPPSTMVHPQP